MFLFSGGCTAGVRDDDAPMGQGPTTASPQTTGAGQDSSGSSSGAVSAEGSAEGSGGGGGPKLDAGVTMSGCQQVDLLFVIDNSDSMQTYQQALTAEFPGFVQAMFEALPPGIGVHVGITTTDFDFACPDSEATANCQSSASLDEITSHYIPPTEGNNGGNGSQGRLFAWASKRWFETSTDDDPAELTAWFSEAAVAAGESGCSFEMPIAAAGWATHPANAATNEGFIQDEGALLVVFFLTDEPDKSPQSESVYADMILQAKSECGGADCVFVSGLIPSCVPEINQKLWQFMTVFDDEADPPFGDIEDTSRYSELFGEFLAGGVADACAQVPVG